MLARVLDDSLAPAARERRLLDQLVLDPLFVESSLNEPARMAQLVADESAPVKPNRRLEPFDPRCAHDGLRAVGEANV